MGEIGIGATLREAREDRGRSVEDVAGSIQMRAIQLQALEDERFQVFGGDVYAKGFIRNYALEVGLDPEPLVDKYRRYVQVDTMNSGRLTPAPVTTTSPRPAPPAWIGWVAGLVLLLGAGWVLASFVGTRAPTPAEVEVATPPPAPAADPSATPTPGGTTAAPAETEEPEPEPTPTFEGVNVTLVFEEASWVRVSTDGTTQVEGLQEAGAAIDFTGEEEVVARVGNAGGVRARLNGEGLGPLGDAAQVVEVRFTEDDAEQL